MGNIKPNPILQGAEVQKQLARQTEEWLRINDAKRRKAERFKASKKREKDQKQARENPGLITARRRAMGL